MFHQGRSGDGKAAVKKCNQTLPHEDWRPVQQHKVHYSDTPGGPWKAGGGEMCVWLCPSPAQPNPTQPLVFGPCADGDAGSGADHTLATRWPCVPEACRPHAGCTLAACWLCVLAVCGPHAGRTLTTR